MPVKSVILIFAVPSFTSRRPRGRSGALDGAGARALDRGPAELVVADVDAVEVAIAD
jgi:hypothetical protein